ncbi:MAG: fasciclin domain-containing protein [Marmoricola sp.]
MTTNLKRVGLSVAALTLTFGLAACGSETTSSSSSTPTPVEQNTPSQTTDASAEGTFGPACDAIPKTGDGSFQGMSTAPVATAASANPVLSTLVAAVTAADLVDTLNSAPEITVFAPANSAFEKIPAKDLDALLKDKAALTKVLTHHVVGGKLSPEQVAGTHETLAGDKITVEGSGESFTIPADSSNIVCGNVTTANATVYVIDTVLSPTS